MSPRTPHRESQDTLGALPSVLPPMPSSLSVVTHALRKRLPRRSRPGRFNPGARSKPSGTPMPPPIRVARVRCGSHVSLRRRLYWVTLPRACARAWPPPVALKTVGISGRDDAGGAAALRSIGPPDPDAGYRALAPLARCRPCRVHLRFAPECPSAWPQRIPKEASLRPWAPSTETLCCPTSPKQRPVPSGISSEPSNSRSPSSRLS